jgi:hypothetical protein
MSNWHPPTPSRQQHLAAASRRAWVGTFEHEEVSALSAGAIAPEPVPLVRDLAGRLMVPGTRISLDVLVADFKRGRTPEWVHDAIFAYYLRHRAELEAYLAEQEREGAEIQVWIEASDPPEGLRDRLLARLEP